MSRAQVWTHDPATHDMRRSSAAHMSVQEGGALVCLTSLVTFARFSSFCVWSMVLFLWNFVTRAVDYSLAFVGTFFLHSDFFINAFLYVNHRVCLMWGVRVPNGT